MSIQDYYIILRPKSTNPYINQLKTFKTSNSFIGILFQDIHAYVPVKIRAETLKLETPEEKVKFQNFLAVKIKNCMVNTIVSLFNDYPKVSEVLDIISDGGFETVKQETVNIVLKPSDYFEEFISRLISNFILETKSWASEYGYRIGMEKMGNIGFQYEHVKAYNKQYFLQFMQRIIDMETPLEISARKWNFTFKDKFNVYWTHGWDEMVTTAAVIYNKMPSWSSSSQMIGNSNPGNPGST